jgi:hypothetical protein
MADEMKGGKSLSKAMLVWRLSPKGKMYPTLYYEYINGAEEKQAICKHYVKEEDVHLSIDELMKLYPVPKQG